MFAAVVASFITISIQAIQPNSQNTSNFYLANIQQALTDPNSNLTFPSSPPPFSPSTYSIWVNSLWFLSLIINLTCAILASLLQQWARRYLEVTQSEYSLHKQARTRTFFAEGIKRFRVPLVFEALPALLHLSVFLFFAGLVVFLWNVNLTIFKLSTSWVGICIALYGCITFISLFSHDSPYRTPLTPLARSITPVILYVLALGSVVLHASFCILSTYFGFYSDPDQPSWMLLYPLQLLINVREAVLLTPEDAALEVSSEIDTQAFMWTLDSLEEDKDLDHFFTGMPGFFNSKVVKEPLQNLNYQKKRKLLDAIIRLLGRTYSSSPSEKDKNHRVEICTNAINQVVAPETFQDILLSLASKDLSGPVQSADVLYFVRRWGTHMGAYNTPLIKAIFSIVVATVPRHDGSWFDLASTEMEESKDALRRYHGDRNSLSLAILIHVTRQHFMHIREESWPSQAISDILEEASKFNVEDTAPELQHKFCALWNEIVDAAKPATPTRPARPAARNDQDNHQMDDRQKGSLFNILKGKLVNLLSNIRSLVNLLKGIRQKDNRQEVDRQEVDRQEEHRQKITQLILRPIHEVFIKLHPTDDARGADGAQRAAPRRAFSVHLGDTSGDSSQYPSCKNPGHRSEPTSLTPVASTSSLLPVSASLHATTSYPSDQPNPPSNPNHGDPLPTGPFLSSPARVLTSDHLIPRC